MEPLRNTCPNSSYANSICLHFNMNIFTSLQSVLVPAKRARGNRETVRQSVLVPALQSLSPQTIVPVRRSKQSKASKKSKSELVTARNVPVCQFSGPTQNLEEYNLGSILKSGCGSSQKWEVAARPKIVREIRSVGFIPKSQEI